MAFCRNCGSEIADGVKFCTGCGTPVESYKASSNDFDVKATDFCPITDGIACP